MIYVEGNMILIRLKIEDEDAIDLINEIKKVIAEGSLEVPALASLKFSLATALKQAGKETEASS